MSEEDKELDIDELIDEIADLKVKLDLARSTIKNLNAQIKASAEILTVIRFAMKGVVGK